MMRRTHLIGIVQSCGMMAILKGFIEENSTLLHYVAAIEIRFPPVEFCLLLFVLSCHTVQCCIDGKLAGETTI